jgi:hypothetical protein
MLGLDSRCHVVNNIPGSLGGFPFWEDLVEGQGGNRHKDTNMSLIQ